MVGVQYTPGGWYGSSGSSGKDKYQPAKVVELNSLVIDNLLNTFAVANHIASDMHVGSPSSAWSCPPFKLRIPKT
jgi:hypothetical protein